MVTREKKLAAYQLFLEGVSKAEIARQLGISRQAVQLCLPKTRQMNRERKVVYPNILVWMEASGCDYIEMSRRAGMNVNTLRGALAGENSTKAVIDKILAVTGLSYEQAFCREDKA